MFSNANGRISPIALVETWAVTAPKPPEFGSTGEHWSQVEVDMAQRGSRTADEAVMARVGKAVRSRLLGATAVSTSARIPR